jgi:hypothetical protein
MSEEAEKKARQEATSTPDYLRHWPGLYMRKGNKIVDALPEDIAVAKSYPEAKDKGAVVGGKRRTILTKQKCYRINEEVRVIHVMEIVESGHKIFVMGPKAIYGEYLDGRLVTPERAPEQIYDGPVLESPGVDYNYDITSYRFSESGRHRIYWQPDEVRSNTLELEIVAT